MSLEYFLASLIAVALTLGAVLMGLKSMGDPASKRLIFRLTFPSNLDTDQVLTWLRTISGTRQSGISRLFNLPSMVFEVWATDRGITHRLHIPRAHVDFVVPQLRSLIPGLTVTPETEEAAHEWTTAVELGHTNPSRTLSIPNATTLSTSLLTGMQGLKPREALLLQWVVSPAAKEHVPSDRPVTTEHFSVAAQLFSGVSQASKEEVADRRAKLSEPNFLGVLRVAAKARDSRRADALIGRIRHSLSSSSGSNNGFRRRITSRKRLMGRITDASTPAVFPAKLSAPEMAALISWPLGESYIVGLPRRRTRHLAATSSIVRTGRVIARSNFPGDERLIALHPVESAKHLQVVGPTGSGKTVLLANLIAQDMEAGRGVVLIESKGDLFKAALDRVPEHRLQDVVLLDVTDTAFPVGFNILQGNPYAVAADIQRLFDHLYPQDARGVRVRQGFYHLILTLMMSEGASRPMTFADIGPLATPRADQEEFADRLIRGVQHVEELAGWWQEITNLPRAQRDQYFKPISDRIWQLNNRRSIRNIIGQSDSTVNLRDIISGRKILLVNLGREAEGKDTAGLLASVLLNSAYSAVMAGAANPKNPTMLYLDEFQDLLNLPIAPEDMFAQARSKGLAMTVAHQHLGQLSRELQDATANNARSSVVFQTSVSDARDFARRYGRSVTEDDFMNQQQFEVLMRLATSEGVSSPVTGITLPPSEPTGFTDKVRELSRNRYARPVAEVEKEIAERRGTRVESKKPTKKKRRFGGKGWDD
ncbi:type IV secretory system conjugative DNA transfer family protein [Streptomyces sp. NPDC003688]